MSWSEVGLKRMLTDWARDPQRRKQCLWRYVETVAAILPLYLLAFLPAGLQYGFQAHFLIFGTLCTFIIGPLAGFVLYEFYLEPTKKAGTYWERGPVEGTTFTRP